MPKIRVTLSIGFAGACHEDEIEINNQEWSDCETDEEREELIHEYWKDWSNDYIDGSAELVE